jgi:hypothetical protein
MLGLYCLGSELWGADCAMLSEYCEVDNISYHYGFNIIFVLLPHRKLESNHSA